MAKAVRKLQEEIDRTLKRIDEGIEVFDETWEKVETAATPSLKEKHEADLKKEIKKLQRYRDQIKTWCNNSDIKKKQPLLDARKRIEEKMEAFKVLEKDSKTKEYSIEGLAKHKKKRKDPASDPKFPIFQWIEGIQEKLRDEVGRLDAEIEDMKSGGKRAEKENRAAIEQHQEWIEHHNWHVEQLDGTREKLRKNECSVKQIQQIREDIEVYVSGYQEPDFFFDDDLYAPLNEPPGDDDETKVMEGDEDEDDDDYEDEDEEEEEEEQEEDEEKETEKTSAPPEKSQEKPAEKALRAPQASPKKDTKGKNVRQQVQAPSLQLLASPPQAAATQAQQVVGLQTAPASAASNGPPPQQAVQAPQGGSAGFVDPIAKALAADARKKSKKDAAGKVAGSAGSMPATPPTGPTSPKQKVVGSGPAPSFSSLLKKTSQQQEDRRSVMASQPQLQPQSQQQQQQQQAAGAAGLVSPPSSAQQAMAQQAALPHAGAQQQQQPQAPSFASQQSSPLQQQQQLPQQHPLKSSGGKGGPGVGGPLPVPQQPQQQVQAQPLPPQGQPQAQAQSQAQQQQPQQQQQRPEVGVPMPSVHGVVGGPQQGQLFMGQPQGAVGQRPMPLQILPQQSPPAQPQMQILHPPAGAMGFRQRSSSGAIGSRSLPAEELHNLALLEASMMHLPQPSDSELPREYTPRNPAAVPPNFPQEPSPIFNDPAVFEKCELDTLFFIFYFHQGTHQQYLAARQLKAQSWRFHKEYLAWFRRHEDPKVTTEEYEQGTYVYFDYANWCQRVKKDFTFYYRHLEDELKLNP